MKKIPTIFERDWDGDRSRVLPVINNECAWVFCGEGVATRKYDGTCVYIDANGVMWKRYTLRPGKPIPDTFWPADEDATNGEGANVIGWVAVDPLDPGDQWHLKAYEAAVENGDALDEGTYEIVGPRVRGNPEQFEQHVLVSHFWAVHLDSFIAERTYDGIRDALERLDVEGFVFHHPDGRMAKIKARDFGIKRGPR